MDGSRQLSTVVLEVVCSICKSSTRQRSSCAFVDGHQSHISLQLVKTAKEKGIHLYCLPPHTTDKLQPLDVGVYGPIKQAWKKIMKD